MRKFKAFPNKENVNIQVFSDKEFQREKNVKSQSVETEKREKIIS